MTFHGRGINVVVDLSATTLHDSVKNLHIEVRRVSASPPTADQPGAILMRPLGLHGAARVLPAYLVDGPTALTPCHNLSES